MKIELSKISEKETELTFTEKEAWLAQAVSHIDEHYERGALEPSSLGPCEILTHRTIEAKVAFRKIDTVYLVSGQIKTFFILVCSRCALEFPYYCQPRFSALFCKDPVLAGIAHLQRAEDYPHQTKVIGHNYGHSGHHRPHTDLFPQASALQTGLADPIDPVEKQPFLESQDLDITYLSQEHIDLNAVLTEQLQLQVPFQPLCKPECLGICSQCGTDQNQNRCLCPKEPSPSPFSVLKHYSF